jgi:murein DD-endopeptidase MepM/ murein hydrolase activator NlpD
MNKNTVNRIRPLGLLGGIVLLAGCVSASPSVLPSVTGPTTTSPSVTASVTASPTAIPPTSEPVTNTPTATDTPPTPAPTDSPAPFVISSPLQGISITELPEILTQDFIQPRPGQDDGHYGVDYAYYRRGDQLSILGTPVLAVLSGRIAAVLVNRPPFGHAVMVETRLDELPADWVAALNLPPAPNPLPTVDRVSCDLSDTADLLARPGESIYTIYAHLNLTPTLQMGENVSAGAVLGEVGNSGYSGNPHLHIETHVGPAGVAFGSLAFYEVATTEQERHNYCLWRLSGVFRVFDARRLFGPSAG